MSRHAFFLGRIFLFGLILLSIIATTYAQNGEEELFWVKGVVKDTLTQTPLAGAHLLRQNGEGVTTDQNGQFQIKISSNEDLLITYLAYLNKRTDKLIQDSIPNGLLEVYLQKDTITLGVVEINPWPIQEDFKPAFLSLDTARNLPKQPIRPPGVAYKPGKLTPPPATVLNPLSYVYERFGKEARRKRKMDKYRKKLHLK